MAEMASGFETLRQLVALALNGQPGTAAPTGCDSAAAALLPPLAHRHRVVPLLGAGLPDGLREPFRRSGLALAQQAIQMEQELEQIAGRLSAARLDFLVIKGPALARQAYPAPEWRAYDDVDIWVPSRQLALAVRALEELSYGRMHRLNERASACARRAGIEVALVKSGRLVEVAHGWAVLAPIPRAARDILEAATTVDIAGTRVRTPAPVHALLLACRHGAHHGWDRLVWIADVAGLWRRLSPAERETACASARCWSMETMLGLGLRLAADHLEIPLDGHAAALADSRRVRELGRRTGLETIGPDSPRASPMERLRFERDAQDSALQSLRIMAQWVFVPTLGDIQAVPLPAVLFPLYWSIRPLRLLRHPWLRDWRKLAGFGQ